jgi:threonine dehydrogenase-like Zn-dependent dehydrogenase
MAAGIPRRPPQRPFRSQLRNDHILGIAILGAGRIGKIHAASVAANPRATLVVIADPLEAAAGPLAKRYGASAICNPAAAIERDDVDAVIIGTPTPRHVELMLHAGMKHDVGTDLSPELSASEPPTAPGVRRRWARRADR